MNSGYETAKTRNSPKGVSEQLSQVTVKMKTCSISSYNIVENNNTFDKIELKKKTK